MEHVKNIDDLRAEFLKVQGLPDGVVRNALLEDVVRYADLYGDLDTAYQARSAFVTSAGYCGQPEKALIAFSWCLSQSDKNPARFPEDELLWKYASIVTYLVDFPTVSKKQIMDMIDNLTFRAKRSGREIRTIELLRWKVAVRMGDKEAAAVHFRSSQAIPADPDYQCPACEQDQKVDYANFLGEDEGALRFAEPIMARTLRCFSVPHLTFGRILMPLLRLGRLEEAAEFHRVGYPLASQTSANLDIIADHLLFLAATDNLARAMKMFQKHLSWAFETSDMDDRFQYFLVSRFLMERLPRGGTTSFQARLPADLDVAHEQDRYQVADLLSWLGNAVIELGTQFDGRNGNMYHVGRIEQAKKWHEMATSFLVN